MKSKFEFYEIVKVTTLNKRVQAIYGKEGWIAGKSFADDGSNRIAYSLFFPDGNWFVFEDEVESTGKLVDPKHCENIDPASIRTLSDGSGEIIK